VSAIQSLLSVSNRTYSFSQTRFGSYFHFLLLLLTIGLLASCAAPVKKEQAGPIFYPPLPNPPRLQYLATFSSERDVVVESSGFQAFLLGERKEATSLVKKPYGVAVYNGAIYVVDTRGNGYGVFDLRNKKAFTIRGSGAGRMQKPINITIDQDGTKYITDTGRNQILVFNAKDKFVRAYGKKDQFKPSDVAVVGDKLFVADLKNHHIQVLSKQSGDVLYSVARGGQKEGELFYPTNIEVSADGHLHVSDTGNFRIQKFTLDGKFVSSYGVVGSGLGQFARPKGIAVDHLGRRYIIDAAFENVQIIDPDGALLLFFGGPGADRDSINLPTDIEIDYDNVNLFQKYADPKFKLEYVILVASQFGFNKVNVYGFGKMEGMDYEVKTEASE